MNSNIIKILEIMSIATSLNSVGFSAGYSFSQKQSVDYLDELIENSKFNSTIFSGIMILETSDVNGNFTVVDGIQRITTISLLLCALCERYKNTSHKNEEARRKIYTRYLVSNGYDVKLRITGKEQEIYRKIVFGESLSEEESKSNLYIAYSEFLDKITTQEISATKLFKVISRMQFMVVFADNLSVPARELYQSINLNKSDLSQINLITSFISQSDENSAIVWKNIVDEYTNLGLAKNLTNFIRDFLSVQNNGKIPNKKALYNTFKLYYKTISGFQSKNAVIENLKRYSKFYLRILQADFEDFEIKKHVTAINENNGQDVYPYLIEVVDDYENGHIDRGIFLDILKMINSFLSAKKEEGTEIEINFASLSGELNKMLALTNYEQQNLDENKITINEINNLSTFGV